MSGSPDTNVPRAGVVADLVKRYGRVRHRLRQFELAGRRFQPVDVVGQHRIFGRTRQPIAVEIDSYARYVYAPAGRYAVKAYSSSIAA